MPTNSELDNIVPDNNISYEDKMNAFLVAKGVDNVLSIDSYGALHTIDQAHHEIHEGDYWFADDVSATLTANAIKYWLLVTPNEATALHSLPVIISTGEIILEVYEGVTVATNGTELPLLNRDRNSTATTTYKFYKDPTTPVTTGCPLVRYVRVGSGKNAAGDSRSDAELILKSNTKYLIKATAITNGTFISCHVNGYVCGLEA